MVWLVLFCTQLYPSAQTVKHFLKLSKARYEGGSLKFLKKLKLQIRNNSTS